MAGGAKESSHASTASRDSEEDAREIPTRQDPPATGDENQQDPLQYLETGNEARTQQGDDERGAPVSAQSEMRTSTGAASRQDPASNTLELLDGILAVTNYLDYIDDGTEVGASKVENVKELRSVAEEFPVLEQFLENVALVQDAYTPTGRLKKSKDTTAVTLMTIHAAKGLEFPVVFIVGMEEGLFPHSRSLMNPGEMEEERRLAYVAITRAMHKLFLTYTRSRLYFGSRSNNLISRFISSIPEHLLDTPPARHSFNDDIYPSPPAGGPRFEDDEF